MSLELVTARAPANHEPRYRHVLLVEDEDALRRVITRNLTGRGIAVREAATVVEALQSLSDELPDLLCSTSICRTARAGTCCGT